MITGDFHTHTRASDGLYTVADNVGVARARDVKILAITDHSFTNIIFHMTKKKFAEQETIIQNINKSGKSGADSGKNPNGSGAGESECCCNSGGSDKKARVCGENSNKSGDILVIQGIEANILKDGTIDVPDEIIPELDILSVGFHRLLQPHMWIHSLMFILGNGWGSVKLRKKMIDSNTAAYLSAMQNYPIDVLCHLNHRCLVDTAAVCEMAAERGIYIELNEKHIETLEEGIDDALKSGVNFILGSDAHKKKKVGAFARVEEFVARHNIPTERIYGMNGKTPTFKNNRLNKDN